MKENILSAKGLCKSFAHNGGQIHILSHVDLTLYQGDFTVIMGASGSGKSTLLYALSGMDRATAGEVLYHGKNIVTMSEKELSALRSNDFGFIFQQLHLVSNLTLFENIVISGYLSKTVTGEAVRNYAEELIEKMRIKHIKNHLPAQVSGGEQQRCAIARAVIHHPKLIFADEPTGALDYQTGKSVLKLLQNMCIDNGVTVVVITHNMALTPMGNKVIKVKNGAISDILVNDNPTPVEEIEW